MTTIISFAGKGGVGKTTTAALTVRALVKAGRTPVLAVDADPNSCLGETLGRPDYTTIGEIREQFSDAKMQVAPGMSKESVFATMLGGAVAEGRGWDLLVMGRPEGPGCYCFVNNILRKSIETLGANYRYVVIDHEAGMEHLSRHLTSRSDLLFVVAERSVVSLRAARRINDLSRALDLKIGRRLLILNRDRGDAGEPGEHVGKALDDTGLEIAARIPADERIAAADRARASFMELEDELPAVRSMETILKIIQ